VIFKRQSPAPRVTAHTPLRDPSYRGPSGRKLTPRHKDAQARLERLLRILQARLETREFHTVTIQLIVQIAEQKDDNEPTYARFRHSWGKRLRTASGGRLGTDTWPATIASDRRAVIVIPTKPGVTTLGRPAHRVKGITPGVSARLQLTAEPLAVQERLEGRFPDLDTLIITAVSAWLEWTPDDWAPRLPPPIIEQVASDGSSVVSGGRTLSHECWHSMIDALLAGRCKRGPSRRHHGPLLSDPLPF